MTHPTDSNSTTGLTMGPTMGPALDALLDTIRQRKGAAAETSYTARLFTKGRRKIAQKVGEEGVEAALAGATNDKQEVIKESADLFYHLFVLWVDMDLDPKDILAEISNRAGTSGLAEKAARTTSQNTEHQEKSP